MPNRDHPQETGMEHPENRLEQETPDIAADHEGHADISKAPSDLLVEIGERLRKAREARGESLDQVERILKLRKAYLQAMEQGDWSPLPGKAYAIGFLRQYAAHLHLDLSDEIQRLKDHPYKLTRPLTFPDPPIAPSRRWAWIAGIAFILLFVAFNVSQYAGHDTAPEVPPDQPTLPSPTEAEPQTGGEAKADSIASETRIPASEQASPHASTDLTLAEDIQPQTQDNEPPPEAQDQGESAGEPAPAVPSLHRYRLEAAGGKVWLQVYLPAESGDGKGALWKETLLQAGEHLLIEEPVARLWLTIGNAGALQISIDGRMVVSAGELGPIGKVLRDYPLDAE